MSGAAILGDGKVVLILEVEDLFILASKQGKNALLVLDKDCDAEQSGNENPHETVNEPAVEGRVA